MKILKSQEENITFFRHLKLGTGNIQIGQGLQKKIKKRKIRKKTFYNLTFPGSLILQPGICIN